MANIERSQRLPFTDSPETVIRMLTDPAFYRAKYEASGFENVQVDPEGDEQRFAVRARYRTQTELPLPGWARKVLPETIEVEQRDEWQAEARRGRLTIHIHGTPVHIEADMQLEEDGGAAATCIDWHFSCSVPLIGGRIVELVADDVCNKAERDHEYGRNHSADYRE